MMNSSLVLDGGVVNTTVLNENIVFNPSDN